VRAKRGGRGLRVVAGEAGGLRLVVPPDARPTTDRVREALFASLGDRVDGTSVLDLYAGSGALGIEALSRGAVGAVLVDRDRAAAQACARNLDTTRLAARARVEEAAVTTFLARGPGSEAPFALVLCDPPYEVPDEEVAGLLDTLAEPGWLTPDAVVVVERRAGGGPVRWPAGWVVTWERRYGDTLVIALAAPRARPDANASVGP
jgi:16S rRNA (guanine966-N2)-methyltransferase